MSHIIKIKSNTTIKSLRLLDLACRMLGTVHFVRGATQHKYFAGKLADCNHKISVIGNEQAYEIGVVKVGDQFVLNADFFVGGYGLQDAVGKDAQKLLQAYKVLEAAEAMQMGGFALTEQTTAPNGDIKCVFEI